MKLSLVCAVLGDSESFLVEMEQDRFVRDQA